MSDVEITLFGTRPGPGRQSETRPELLICYNLDKTLKHQWEPHGTATAVEERKEGRREREENFEEEGETDTVAMMFFCEV